MSRENLNTALFIAGFILFVIFAVFLRSEDIKQQSARLRAVAEQFANDRGESLIYANQVCENKFTICKLFIKTDKHVYRCADLTTRFCVEWDGAEYD